MEPLKLQNLKVKKEQVSLEYHTHYLTYSLSKQKNKIEEPFEANNVKINKCKNKKQEEIPESYYQVLNDYVLAANP